MRANVYSFETLPPDQAEAVTDGINHVAEYIGQTIAHRWLKVSYGGRTGGKVNPEKARYRKLDNLVELHVFVNDFGGIGEKTLGVGLFGTGVAHVDNTRSSGLLDIVTAHEVAHSLGFVDELSDNIDPHSEAHCINPNCLMHKSLLVDKISAQPKRRSILARIIGGVEPSNKLRYQSEFCGECKDGMRSQGQQKIRDLRTSRLLRGKII